VTRSAATVPPQASLAASVTPGACAPADRVTLAEGARLPLGSPAEAPCSLATRPAGVDQARALLQATTFPALDPYAAIVAASVDAVIKTQTPRTEQISIELPQHLAHPLPVTLGLEAGPHAPMMVIFPGTGGDADDKLALELAQQAKQQGMNFVVLPNPWSKAWLAAGPSHLPAVVPREVEANCALLQALQAKLPAYFEHVSGVGMSYGALLGAATVRAEQAAASPRVINGTFVSISPPENLVDSMHALSHFGDGAEVSSLTLAGTCTAYALEMARHGLGDFARSALAQAADHSAERALAFRLGPQAVLFQALDLLHLPTAHIATLEDFSNSYLKADPWFAEHHTSVEAVSDAYRYSTLLADVAGHGVPVVTLTAQDDCILTADNRATLAHEAAGTRPDQLTYQYEHGSHMGLLLDPQIREAVGRIAACGAGEPV
jgi:predicted alpha/beta-fold hydrolase